MDLTDEVDLAILDLYDLINQCGVSRVQALRLLINRVHAAYCLDDGWPPISPTIH